MTRRRLWFIGRDEKSLCDNLKLASPKGEGFQPSLKGTLNNVHILKVPGKINDVRVIILTTVAIKRE
jgi:hypothetical protein